MFVLYTLMLHNILCTISDGTISLYPEFSTSDNITTCVSPRINRMVEYIDLDTGNIAKLPYSQNTQAVLPDHTLSVAETVSELQYSQNTQADFHNWSSDMNETAFQHTFFNDPITADPYHFDNGMEYARAASNDCFDQTIDYDYLYDRNTMNQLSGEYLTEEQPGSHIIGEASGFNIVNNQTFHVMEEVYNASMLNNPLHITGKIPNTSTAMTDHNIISNQPSQPNENAIYGAEYHLMCPSRKKIKHYSASHNKIYIPQTSNTEYLIDTHLEKYDIRHLNSNAVYKIYLCSENLPKKMYSFALLSFWNVFYGYYDNDKNKTVKFHIQYTNDLSFMKTTIDESICTNKLSSDIIDMIDHIHDFCNRSKKVLIYRELIFNKQDIEPYDCNKCRAASDNLPKQLCVTDGLASIILSDFNKYVGHLNKKMHLFFSYLDDNTHEKIDIHDLRSSESTRNLIINAHMLFNILAISMPYFKSIKHVDINAIYTNQLNVFLTSDLYVKLVIYPEFMSLHKYSDDIRKIKRKCNNKHKLYIGYYAMYKFEAFLGPLKRYLQQYPPTKQLYAHDALFYRTYLAELYLTYIYSHCFDLSMPCMVRYMYLNRLQMLCVFKQYQDAIYYDMCKLIGFLLFNLLDSHLLFSIDRAFRIAITKEKPDSIRADNYIVIKTLQALLNSDKISWQGIVYCFIDGIHAIGMYSTNYVNILNQVNSPSCRSTNIRGIVSECMDKLKNELVIKLRNSV